MRIALVSCTKLKESIPCESEKMYQKSMLFSEAVKYIKQNNYDDWFILSARHGLLHKAEIIAPHDFTLNKMEILE